MSEFSKDGESPKKEPFSKVAFGTVTALALGSSAFVGYLVFDNLGTVKPFPTPEKLQAQKGREVYVLPDGRDMREVSDYCILIGSKPSDKADRFGENKLEHVCSAKISHDLDQGSYGVAELTDLCEEADGQIDVVAAENGDVYDAENARSACVTDKPIV